MEKNMPLVSLVLPVYRVGNYLEDCLASIRAQTYENWEAILVDDGGTDGCPAMCREAEKADKRFRVLRLESNQGVSVARNEGQTLARGTYIGFVDSDDAVAPDYLEKLVEAAEREQADITVCGFSTYEEKTKKQLHITRLEEKQLIFDDTHRYVYIGAPWAKLFRSDFLRKYGIRFSPHEVCEDLSHSVVTYSMADTVAFARTLYYYHVRNGSITYNLKKEADVAVPFHGIEEAIRTVDTYSADPVRHWLLEYATSQAICAILLGNMLMWKNRSRRREVCRKFQEIINTSFPDLLHNPYLFGKARKRMRTQPLLKKAATEIFAVACHWRILYPVTAVETALMRMLRRFLPIGK